MLSIERFPTWCGMSARMLALGATMLVGVQAANAGDLWLEYVDQTSLRLDIRAAVGVNDNQEKDFAWGDVDHDGDTDLVVVRKRPFTFAGGRVNVLFLQEGTAEGHAVDGVFVDHTDEFIPGFNDETNDRDVILADVNGDGWDDIVTATTLSDGMPKSISHPRIYMNLGMSDGQWQGYDFDADRTPQFFTMGTNMPVAPRFCSVAAGDVDMDGDLDLYFGDYDGSGAGGASQNSAVDLNDRLLINDGNGNFTDSLQSRMTSQMLSSAFGVAVEMADMNQDGVIDIIKDTALNPPQYVAISYNDPDNPGFFDTFDRVYEEPQALPYHIDVGDLNNDGWLDIVVTEDDSDKYLLSQGVDSNGIVQFGNPRVLNGSSNFSFGGNNLIVDLDNDGFNDVIVTDVDVDDGSTLDRTYLYRNLGDVPNVTLTDVDGNQAWTPIRTHDVAVFDFTGDGFKDIIYGTENGYEIWVNQPAVSLVMGFPNGLPEELTPNATTLFPVNVAGSGTEPVASSLEIFVSIDGGAFEAADVSDTGNNQYVVELPGADCGSSIQFYFRSETTTGTLFDPPGAPENTYSASALYGRETIVDERFETDDPEWVVTDTNVSAGSWVRVDPVQTNFGGDVAQPGDDFGQGAETMCYITGQHTGGGAGSADLDGGPTILTSPVIDFTDVENATIEYARWMFNSNANQDELVTEITNNGSDWVEVHATTSTNSEWELTSFDVADFVAPSANIQVRFRVADEAPASLTEAGIDNFSVVKVICEDSFEPEILQVATAIPFELQGFGGFIDPRSESSNGSEINRGLDRVTVVFNEPVRNADGSALSADAFTASDTGATDDLTVVGIETDDNQTVTVLLNRIITVQEWTTIRADVEDMSGNPIQVCDGCDTRPNEISVAFLPGDINQSGTVNPIDLFAFRQLVNGLSTPAVGTAGNIVDTNRDGSISPLDLFAYRQLINGVGQSTRAWAGASLNNPQP